MFQLLAATALSLGIGGSLASDVPHACRTAVAGELDKLAIEQTDVSSLNVIRQIQNFEIGTVVGYNAWVSLQEKPGSLVIKMTRTCRVQEVYTRGGLIL